jgi:Tfp pilus assembly protein PilN
MRAVNLLPSDLERQSGGGSRRVPLFVAAGGIAAVTVGAVALFMSASGSISDGKAQLDSVEAALAQLPTGAQPAVAPGSISQERADRVAALSAALTTRVPLDRLLRELAYVLPEDAWLTGLTVTAPAAADAGTGSPGAAVPPTSGTQGVTIEGATYSNRSVARVLARLAAMPSIDDVRLVTTTRREPAVERTDQSAPKAKKARKKQKTVVTFSISANIRAGSGS